MSKFTDDVKRFNKIYGISCLNKPNLKSSDKEILDRLLDFKNILSEELDEVDFIIEKLIRGDAKRLDILIELSDLLGDLQVFCASEMVRFGLPQDQILSLIMASNFSKLQEDGTAKFDERGKLQKGPNYWKPEPKIKELLERLIK